MLSALIERVQSKVEATINVDTFDVADEKEFWYRCFEKSSQYDEDLKNIVMPETFRDQNGRSIYDYYNLRRGHKNILRQRVKGYSLKKRLEEYFSMFPTDRNASYWNVHEDFRGNINSIFDYYWFQTKRLSKIDTQISKSMLSKDELEPVFDKSLEAASVISNLVDKSKILSKIGKELSQSGLKERSVEAFKTSIEAANTISDDYRKSVALSTIAEELSKSKLSQEELVPLFEKFIEVANSIIDIEDKSKVLSTIASEMSTIGYIEQSLEVVDAIIDKYKSKRCYSLRDAKRNFLIHLLLSKTDKEGFISSIEYLYTVNDNGYEDIALKFLSNSLCSDSLGDYDSNYKRKMFW